MAIETILISDNISEIGINGLRQRGFQVDYDPKITHQELLVKVQEYVALVVRSRTKVTEEVLEAGKNLKVVGRLGVGLDNIDSKAASKRGIKIINTPEASVNSVAELIIGLMLSIARGIHKADSSMKNGQWLKNSIVGFELNGRTLGVIGMGRIGSKVSELARGFGMNILGYDIIPINQKLLSDLKIEEASFERVLSDSDFVTLHVPLETNTKKMIDKRKLSLMKKTAYLVNASRGEVINERALYQALKEGIIAGAAIDVYGVEPPLSRDLISLPNILCTPHIGAQTVDNQISAANLLVERLTEALRS